MNGPNKIECMSPACLLTLEKVTLKLIGPIRKSWRKTVENAGPGVNFRNLLQSSLVPCLSKLECWSLILTSTLVYYLQAMLGAYHISETLRVKRETTIKVESHLRGAATYFRRTSFRRTLFRRTLFRRTLFRRTLFRLLVLRDTFSTI